MGEELVRMRQLLSCASVTYDGTRSYSYDTENRLVSSSSGAFFFYDPLGDINGTGNPPALYYETLGGQIIAETKTDRTTDRRFVFGPGMDEPLVYYEGSGTSSPRYLVADERGSIVAVTDPSGNALTINKYDEYGNTVTTNSLYMGRFLYTGQRYFSGLGIYYYKARMYHPALGRFMQPDPIGYDDGMNMYAYVGGDPVNFTDPTGLCGAPGQPCDGPDTVITRGWTLNPHWRSGAEGGGSRTGSPVGSTPEANTHLYDFDRDLTRRDTKCTAADVADALARFAVPGNDGIRARNGQTYTARVFGGAPLGDVTVRIGNGGMSITNRTLPDHFMVDGTVRLSAYPREEGGFGIRVRGEGENTYFKNGSRNLLAAAGNFLAAVGNEAFGPIQFKRQVNKRKAHLNKACGG